MDTSKLKDRLDGKIKASQAESNERKVVNMEKTMELAPVNVSNYVALSGNALEIINENLQNTALSPALFDVIKSPSGGITSFSVPGLSGENMEKELSGIILGYTMPRAYWDTPEPVEGTPPVCFSSDSLTSSDGKACSRCEFNDFGSKDGDSNAKACKEFVEILLLRPDSIMPVIVRVSVTSKQTFLKYMTRLVGRLISLSGVVTKITLEKAVSKGGQPYALYNFEVVGTLNQEEAANAKAFGAKFMEIINATEDTAPIAKAG